MRCGGEIAGSGCTSILGGEGVSCASSPPSPPRPGLIPPPAPPAEPPVPRSSAGQVFSIAFASTAASPWWGPVPSLSSGASGGGCMAPPGSAAGGHGAGDEALHASSPPRQEHAWHSRDPPRASPHAPPSEEQGRHRASVVKRGWGHSARNPLVELTAAPHCYTLHGCTATLLSPCWVSPQSPPRGAGWGHGSPGMLRGGDSPAQVWGHSSPLGAAPGCPICPWEQPVCQGMVLLCWPSSGYTTGATRCLPASPWPCSLLASQSATPVPRCLAPCARRGVCSTAPGTPLAPCYRGWTASWQDPA